MPLTLDGSNGIITSSINNGATIKQVVSSYQTSNFSTNSYTWVDFLTVTINLTSPLAVVLVTGVVLGGDSDHGASRVIRNGTQIPYSGVPGRGNTNKSITPSSYSQAFGNNAILGGGFIIFDQPGSSSVTYKIQVSSGPSSGPQTFLVGYNTSGSTAYFDAVNYLQVAELA
jgi:hypothetical protein